MCSRRLTEDQADRARHDEHSLVHSFRSGLPLVNLAVTAACVGPVGSQMFPLEKKCHLGPCGSYAAWRGPFSCG